MAELGDLHIGKLFQFKDRPEGCNCIYQSQFDDDNSKFTGNIDDYKSNTQLIETKNCLILEHHQKLGNFEKFHWQTKIERVKHDGYKDRLRPAGGGPLPQYLYDIDYGDGISRIPVVRYLDETSRLEKYLGTSFDDKTRDKVESAFKSLYEESERKFDKKVIGLMKKFNSQELPLVMFKVTQGII